MTMRWQDMSSLNRKWDRAVLAGLGGGVLSGGSTLLPASGLGQDPPGGSTFWWNIQMNVNDWLDQNGMQPVDVTERPDEATCAALAWLLEDAERLPPTAYFYEFLSTPENRAVIDEGCAKAGVPVPEPGAAPVAPPPSADEPAPSAPACVEGVCDCYVLEGDSGKHIKHLQRQLNVALDQAGFRPINVTGVYDAATCGAVFELGGAFKPDYPDFCDNPEGEWIVPLECPDMKMPEKKASRAGMFAIGGLLLAAGAGGVYWLSKR